MPGRGFVRMLVLATFITPPYTGAVRLDPARRSQCPAGSTASTSSATGAEAGRFNIYSFTGLAVVIALYSFPYIFIFTSAALELVSLGDGGRPPTSWAREQWRTMRRVTLPLALAGDPGRA